MGVEVPGIRPAVISSVLKGKLDEYRGFRHIVRNVYTYKLNPTKMEGLVASLNTVMAQTEVELEGFIEFIKSVEEK